MNGIDHISICIYNCIRYSAKKKFEPRWSETVYRIRQRNKRGGDTSNLTYVYKLEQMTGEPLTGTFRREELLVIPEMETEY